MQIKRRDLEVVQWFVALLFLGSGALKLSGVDAVTMNFESWGFPLRFMYFIGLCEMAGAIGVLLPWHKIRGLAALGLACIMGGAVFTHVHADQWGRIWFPLALFAILVALAVSSLYDLRHPKTESSSDKFLDRKEHHNRRAS